MPYQQMGSMWYDPSSGAISATNPDAASSGQMPSLGQIVSAPAQQMQNYSSQPTAPQGVSSGDWRANQMMQQMGMNNGTTPTPAPSAAPPPSLQQMANASLRTPPTGLNFTPRGTIDPQILNYYKNNPAFSGTMQMGKPIQAGGYQISPSFNAMTGNSANGTEGGGEFNGVSAWDGTSPKYQQYDANGAYLGDYDVSHHSMMEKIAPFIPALFAGGAMALGGGLGAGTGAATGGMSSTLDGAMFPYSATAGGEAVAGGTGAAELSAGAGLSFGAPLGADATAAYSGLAGSVTPEAMAAAMGMTPAAFSSLGQGGLGAAGAAAGMTAGTAASGGIPNGLGSLGSALGNLLQGSGSNSGSGGGGLADLLGNNNFLSLLGGGLDAYKQNKAGDTMKSWLDAQQAKIDGLYAPGSPEYNQLWEEMSRKDAAAGRNSQYGPRSVDFAAKIATTKADQTQRFTTGVSKAYADALNQQASSPTGLLSALQRNGLLNNAGGSLGSILKALSNGTPNNLGGGITMSPDGGITANGSSPTDLGGPAYSNDDIWNMINGGGYGSPTPNLTQADLNDWWMN